MPFAGCPQTLFLRRVWVTAPDTANFAASLYERPARWPRLFFDARGLRKRDSAGFVEALAHALYEVTSLPLRETRNNERVEAARAFYADLVPDQTSRMRYL